MNVPRAVTPATLPQLLEGRTERSPFAVMLDVDGTLAPIAPTPAKAEVPRATLDVLRQLVSSPGIVLALVTGRSANDAWRMTGIPGAWVIGNHGFEVREPNGTIDPDPRAAVYLPAIDSAAQALTNALADIGGVFVENKRWTLSVHYRLAEEAQVARIIDIAEGQARRLDLRILHGKKIVELRPPLSVHKGSASVDFARRAGVSGASGSAIYVGDDRTDEDAFDALRSAFPRAITIRVATPDEASRDATRAELIVPSPAELRAVLEWIVQRRATLAPVR